MKIPSITEVIFYTKTRIESTQVLWLGRTIYILGALAGVCLVYLLRDRLKEMVSGGPQTNPLRDMTKGPEVDPSTALKDPPKAIEAIQPTDDTGYRTLKREGISLQLHLERLIEKLSNWENTEESSPLWAKRQHLGKGVVVDLNKQIERIRQGRRKNAQWDSCQEKLIGLLQIENGKIFCTELKTLLKTLLDLNKERMDQLVSKLPVYTSKEFESYEEYLNYLLPADKKDVRNELSNLKIEKEQIKEIKRKSFDGEWRKLREHVGSKLEEKLKKEALIYPELDLLYRICTPLEAEIAKLINDLTLEPYAQEAVHQLTRMRTLLFSLDAENFGESIERLEALDKERQISQLRNYQAKKAEDLVLKKDLPMR